MALPAVASDIVQHVLDRKTAVKTAVYGSKYANKKQLMSIVCETLKYSEILQQVIDGSRILNSEKHFKKKISLLKVLLYQHVIGRGLNGCFSKYKVMIEKHKSAIHSAVVMVKLKRKVTDLRDTVVQDKSTDDELPRYIRVNTILTDQLTVLNHFTSSGFALIQLTAQAELPDKWISADQHVPGLLALPPGTDLHDNELLKDGHIIIQDKASCIPALVLNPPPGSHVVDSCAAPGNKTTQLAALLANSGKIVAFERSPSRCKTLRNMLSKAKVTCCNVIQGDFTKSNLEDYKDVEYILVDPSCSGSGIPSRMASVVDDEQSISDSRLDKLSRFQATLLKHALSFPNVQRVVYSTCSIHEEENEKVVQDVLSQMPDFTLEHILPDWTERGHDLESSFSIGARCVRATPQVSNTIGFFVGLFVRKT